jgi:hypothetical protein
MMVMSRTIEPNYQCDKRNALVVPITNAFSGTPQLPMRSLERPNYQLPAYSGKNRACPGFLTRLRCSEMKEIGPDGLAGGETMIKQPVF